MLYSIDYFGTLIHAFITSYILKKIFVGRNLLLKFIFIYFLIGVKNYSLLFLVSLFLHLYLSFSLVALFEFSEYAIKVSYGCTTFYTILILNVKYRHNI